MRRVDNYKYSQGQAFSRRCAAFAAAITLCGAAVGVVCGSVKPFAFTAMLNEPESALSVSESIGRVFAPYSLPEVFRFHTKPDDGDNYADVEAPPDALPVMKTTLRAPETLTFIDGVYINNESGKKISLPDEYALPEISGDPAVLIYHTHGTEAYNPGYTFYGAEFYSVNTEDIEKNIVHIGAVIAETLEKRGVSVIHLTEMFDADGYSDAYDRSCEAVEKVLKKYPSVKIVLDIHRDSVIYSDGTKLRTVAKTPYGDAAQLMLLMGTGKSGREVPRWRENLTLALTMYREIKNINAEIMRPVLLRATRYNQHLSPGAMLLEVGTCGNTLPEAERAAKIFAEAFVNALVN